MKFIDWFAGIGGFRRGMELAGHECVGGMLVTVLGVIVQILAMALEEIW